MPKADLRMTSRYSEWSFSREEIEASYSLSRMLQLTRSTLTPHDWLLSKWHI